ncbi:MAG TPA: hypothetical protein PKN44_16465, partial [Bacteroidales bacterium]|nr:hypothetical protein [Bacteroidales bacterium]
MIEKLRNFWMIYSKEYYKFKDVGIFIALLLVFTVLGYLWKLTGYRIFGIAVLEPTYAVLIKAVLISSGELLQHVFNLNVIVERVTNRIYLSRDS